MDRSSRQKINKETLVLNNTLEYMGLIDTYRTFHSKREEYTFFSIVHAAFSRINHILDHKKVSIHLRLKSYQAWEIGIDIYTLNMCKMDN